MMIIESEQQYLNFLNHYNHHELIINAIGCDERYHPVADELCAVFIKSIFDSRDYVIAVNHPDTIFCVNKQRLLDDLNKFTNTLWTFDKKRTQQLFPINKIYDICIYDYMETGNVFDISQLQTTAHAFYSRMYGKYSDLNCVIPLVLHAEWYEKVHDSVLPRIKTFQLDNSYHRINNDVSESFRDIESNGLCVNSELFSKFFENKDAKVKDNFVYTQYNIFTSTGRPSNRFGNINYAALKKDDGCRASFVSRYGTDGYLFMIDYSAYHPRLISQLVRYNLPSDVYNYLGKYYFNKEVLTDEEIKAAKTTTFQLLYGNIPEKYSQIPFFIKIKEYIEHRWNHFITHGYVETPIFKRRITPNNISEPNPNKLFNYILQASETEYNVAVLKELVLALKKTSTKPILYTYDSVLFDVHQNDGDAMMKKIKTIMSPNDTFPVKCYKGNNYHEMYAISI